MHRIEKPPTPGSGESGIRIDIPGYGQTAYYQFFDDILIDGWTWSESFPSQAEILSYF